MKIDIDKLSEDELIDLNNRIVARLRFLNQMRAHSAIRPCCRAFRSVTYKGSARGVPGSASARLTSARRRGVAGVLAPVRRPVPSGGVILVCRRAPRTHRSRPHSRAARQPGDSIPPRPRPPTNPLYSRA